jgi:hypothetical protein
LKDAFEGVPIANFLVHRKDWDFSGTNYSQGRQELVNYLTSYDFKSIDGYLPDDAFDGKKTTWNVHEFGWNNTIAQYPFAQFIVYSISESLYLYQLSANRYSRA